MVVLTLQNVIFLLLLFLIAFLYSSVGHGGASGYLALLSLFSIQPSMIKSSSLLLNIGVSFIAFIQYYRSGYFKWKLFLPFAITSIPAAYFAGKMFSLNDDLYKKILGLCLLFPIVRLMGIIGKEKTTEIEKTNLAVALIIGASIGLVSGMIGIGGGIFLSPILLLAHWANMKETAAVSALFILVNSIAGFVGIINSGKGITINSEVYSWLLFALAGGIAGAYYGSKKITSTSLNYILAFVLAIASLKLLLV